VATKQKTSAGGSLLELVLIVAVALGLALGIQAFLVKPYRIPSASMVPTLQEEQRVLVNRIGARFTDPSVGDVVVFHPPVGANQSQCGAPLHENPDTGEVDQVCTKATPTRDDSNFIKRVVAGPGDTIAVRDGRAVVNGKPLDEPYIRPCGGGDVCNLPREFRVPADHYFMMGDNRGSSDDSRFWGPVPEEWVIGEAFATYWPPDRIGLF